MKNLKTFENFDDFDSKIQPEEFSPEPSMEELENEVPERDLATDIRAILDEELYTGPGSHPDSTTVLGVDEAVERILKLIDGGVEGE